MAEINIMKKGAGNVATLHDATADDISLNQITANKNILTSPTTAPTPAKGIIYYDSAAGKFKASQDGSTFVDLIGSGSGTGLNKATTTFTSQTSVSFNHALSDSNPQIQVYDNLNEQITPDRIDITDSNNILVEFAASTTGTIVVHGGTTSIVGGVATFLHTQSSTATTWTVTHNLNDLNPLIQVFDSTGDPVEPQSVTITSENAFDVTFGTTQTGKVRVLAGKFAGGSGTGNFLPDTDDTYNIGSASFRWKDVHTSGQIKMNSTSTTQGDMKFTLRTSDPTTPAEGEIWYDSTSKQFKGFNGTSTIILG